MESTNAWSWVAERTGGPERPATSEQLLRVMLASDDRTYCRLLASDLRREGCDVVMVDNGPELFDNLTASLAVDSRRAPPDLVISEVGMPRLSGLEVLERIRDRAATTPFLLITALADEGTRARVRSLGASAVLEKPFTFERLRAAVRDMPIA